MWRENTQDEDLEHCQALAEASRVWLDSGKRDNKAKLDLVQAVEAIAWDPDDRTEREVLEEHHAHNPDLYLLDILEDESRTPVPSSVGGISLGHVRGLSMVWPVEDHVYSNFVEHDDYDWSCIDVPDLTAYEACHPGRTIFLESIVNLPKILSQRSWFRESGRTVSSKEIHDGGIESLHFFMKHVGRFIPQFRIWEDKDKTQFLECYGKDDGAKLPRFIAEVHPEEDAEGNEMTRFCHFLSSEKTTTRPDIWHKRYVDLGDYRKWPLTPRAKTFANILIEARKQAVADLTGSVQCR